MKLALDSARELSAGDLSETRVAVNEVLLLSGLELQADGRLLPVRASRTADDARTRADRRHLDQAVVTPAAPAYAATRAEAS